MPIGPKNRGVDLDDFAEALEIGGLTVVYQPKIALPSDQIVGVEALARWLHPEFGPVSPAEFIPLAESSDLINPFTEWVVATAAADWVVWRQRGLTTNIAVNVSAKNLDRLEFPDIVAGICSGFEMPCSDLTIELTESATQGAIKLLDTLTRFRIKGIGISLDDFGTGYASLTQLQQLPFSDLKIDKSFVTNADTSKDCRAIVRALIDLAHMLDLKVIAEGVETEPVRDLLIDYQCDLAQGYHFARPMAASALVDWVFARSTSNPRRLAS
jgi:EAL domain-containing protein (putative c-di-GMP-specific phosphodiesterase class I)